MSTNSDIDLQQLEISIKRCTQATQELCVKVLEFDRILEQKLAEIQQAIHGISAYRRPREPTRINYDLPRKTMARVPYIPPVDEDDMDDPFFSTTTTTTTSSEFAGPTATSKPPQTPRVIGVEPATLSSPLLGCLEETIPKIHFPSFFYDNQK